MKGNVWLFKQWRQAADDLAQNDAAWYRLCDYDNAMQEIARLVEHVNNGDVSLVNSEGFHIPRDLDLFDLWERSDGYHSGLPPQNEPFD